MATLSTKTTTTMKSFLFSLLLLLPSCIHSKYHAHVMDEFWIDPATILERLDEYEAFYVEPHHCVWSECAVDDTDDGYVGDNRDGDEQWYQYRTQDFCANAAYSLYGVKKGEFYIWGCTRGHFINSFFTYGGADNFLKAVGIEPIIYYGNSSYHDDDGDDYYQGVNASNVMCVAIDEDYAEGIESDGYDNNNNNNNEDNSNSGSGDDGWSSTLGCSAEGDYVIAAFDANTCDGNYFYDVMDDFYRYNRDHHHIGCHHIWNYKKPETNWNMQFLMNNSWTCDLDLYPNGCPDPFGKKARFDFALRTVSHGGNARLAYKNMMWRRPLRIMSKVFVVLAVLLLAFAYNVRNNERIRVKAAGGKKGRRIKITKRLKGYFACMWEDTVDLAQRLGVLIKLQWNTMIYGLRNKARKGRRKDRASSSASTGSSVASSRKSRNSRNSKTSQGTGTKDEDDEQEEDLSYLRMDGAQKTTDEV